ncbi:DUF4147 domain-containing protein [Leptolyngbya sp. 15MV]|nr:DUF4147 domain-containing protein [Leptolyngbya sp. 15MV]
MDVARHIATGRHEFAAAEGFTPAHISRALGDAEPASLPIVLMLSGGASACLASPMPGLSVEHLRDVTAALLRAGCTIDELNTVRRHLELLKGGRLAAHAYPVPIEALVLSDVVSGDVSAIGSGPVSPDPTTYADALDVLRQADALDVVPAVTRFLEAGARGEHPETIKPDDLRLSRARVRVIGSVGLVADAALARATELGFSIAHCHTPMVGDAREQGAALGRQARGATPRPAAIILAGETTVAVPPGSGIGGRNQHLALAAALEIDGAEGVAIATFATDGVDGPTDAAGAIVTGGTAELIRARGIDPSAALEQRDSHRALDAADALVRTGPTGTNVNDLAVALVYEHEGASARRIT